ncbi:peptidoglycan endopeptidase LytE [Oceanobacillus limi]|uniref:Peptidoglycan endopeptidase LytE n=1 Tax=Oceanobacillus limi TaxID=930131 RepID=A0A1I0HB03_9BACI|nr:NlpC/P60 family protein [Oceanobacillus limi]SET80893.1 peptidoglycan endopeptidase LytE [Oceanobacillus limi]
MKLKVKSLYLLLSISLVFSTLFSNPFTVDAEFKQVPTAGVYVNGKIVDGINPIQYNGEYYVPIIYISKILGYNHIIFEEDTKTYQLTDGSTMIRVTMGGTKAKRGDGYINIKPPLWTEVEKTGYLPLSSASVLFNADITFQKSDGSIRITTPANYHLVQKGDTLWRIAKAYHTNVELLRAVNDMTSNTIYIGQKLRLPPKDQAQEREPEKEHQEPKITKPPSGANWADNLITEAKKYIGAKYKFGATLSEAPELFDCSSYTQLVFLNNGVEIPRVSRDQASIGSTVSNLQKGDLMFFTTPEMYSDGRVGHVGIYMGNGNMIHASTSKGVTITENVLQNPYWSKNYLFSKRVIQ